MTKKHRVIVISDLHLGSGPPYMLSRPDRLVSFLSSLPTMLASDESLELVIAGDFLDFLAISPFKAWTPDPVEARTKLQSTMKDSHFSGVFDALRNLISKGHTLTVLIGNHDVEMALPGVQQAFLDRMKASPREVLFIDDGRAYRIGKALIEHGNRYDGANVNDWQNVRQIASAQSRYEPPKDALKVSAGSNIVEKVVNDIRPRYPFIDLLQPQGEVVALLLAAFEPKLKDHWNKIVWLFHGKKLEEENKEGLQPGESRYIAYSPLEEEDEELAEAFGELYTELKTPPEKKVSWSGTMAILQQATSESLSEIFDRGEHAPAKRLHQIRVAMRKLLLDDTSLVFDGPTQQYGTAAKRIVESSKGETSVVLMGHTHLPRHIGPLEQATYINTGTWTDVIRVPSSALDDTEQGNESLEAFLHQLRDDQRPDSLSTYGDIRLSNGGDIIWAKLCTFHA